MIIDAHSRQPLIQEEDSAGQHQSTIVDGNNSNNAGLAVTGASYSDGSSTAYGEQTPQPYRIIDKSLS